MHQGKKLKELLEIDERGITEIATLIGRSRNKIYQLYKEEKLSPFYVNKFKSIGIIITDGDTQNVLSDPAETYNKLQNERADYVIIAVLEKQLREQIEQTKLLRIIADNKNLKEYEKAH